MEERDFEFAMRVLRRVLYVSAPKAKTLEIGTSVEAR